MAKLVVLLAAGAALSNPNYRYSSKSVKMGQVQRSGQHILAAKECKNKKFGANIDFFKT
jgi:hypothetical protein